MRNDCNSIITIRIFIILHDDLKHSLGISCHVISWSSWLVKIVLTQVIQRSKEHFLKSYWLIYNYGYSFYWFRTHQLHHFFSFQMWWIQCIYMIFYKRTSFRSKYQCGGSIKYMFNNVNLDSDNCFFSFLCVLFFWKCFFFFYLIYLFRVFFYFCCLHKGNTQLSSRILVSNLKWRLFSLLMKQ